MGLNEILTSGAEAMGLPLGAGQLERFRRYFELLEETGKVMNLTAIKGETDVARLHFLDCMALLNAAELKNKRIIDIGTGAGFPGLPLKIAEPSIRLTLLDSLGKRVKFLENVCAELNIEAECVSARAEEFCAVKGRRESYDVAVSRAVAGLNVLSELCLPYVNVNGLFISMKSVGSDEELESAKNALKSLGAEVERVYDYTIPGTDITHRAILLRKTHKTPTQYPRRFAKIKLEPL